MEVHTLVAQCAIASIWTSRYLIICVHQTTIILSPKPQQIAFKSRVDQYICQ